MRALTGVLVALHIISSVAGFGAVVATGVLAPAANREPPSPAALRYFRPGLNVPSHLVLLVPVFGAGLEASSGWGDVHLAWPWIALAIWVVAAVAGAGVHWPSERRVQALLVAARAGAGPAAAARPAADKTALGPAARRPPAAGTAAELQAACRRVVWSSGVMTACFVAALVVMVTQPR